MASTATPEALEVRRKGRRRLVGAFAIVIAMVVFLPMVLDPTPRQQKQDLSLAIPAKDSVAPLPPPTEKPAAKDAARTAPASEPAKVAADVPKAPPPAEPVKATAAAATPAAIVAPAAPASTPARAETAGKAAAPAPATAKPAESPSLEGFAVQIGAFKDEARLKKEKDKLVAAKVKHYTERLATSSGELTRLRAGPYPTREAADKAAAQLKRAGLDGKVVPLP